MKILFVEMMRDEKACGKTLLPASHNFDEVGRTCERVGFLHEGKFLFFDRIEALKKAYATESERLEEVFMRVYGC